MSEGRDQEEDHSSRIATLLCHTSAGGRDGFEVYPGVVRAQEQQDDRDLHTCHREEHSEDPHSFR